MVSLDQLSHYNINTYELGCLSECTDHLLRFESDHFVEESFAAIRGVTRAETLAQLRTMR